MLEVADNGLGMDLNKPNTPVFQLFSRQHTNGKGTGVGCYLVQRIVRRQGGHSDVVSTPGFSTTCTIHWPTRKSVS